MLLLHPRSSHRGLTRNPTVSLADLDGAPARDKLTGKDLTTFLLDAVLLERHQPFLAQPPQHAIDMHRAQPERVGQMILRQRAIETRLVSQTHELQPGAKFEKEMRDPLLARPPAKVDQMFHHHGLVARHSPQHRRREPLRGREGVEELRRDDLRRLDPRHGLDAVIRCPAGS